MIIENSFNFSSHALSRISSRKIKIAYVSLCLRFGKEIRRTKIKFYFLTKKILKDNNLTSAIEGLCVLVSSDNTIITAYKNKKAISEIKKLSKRSLKQ